MVKRLFTSESVTEGHPGAACAGNRTARAMTT
ncbi:S-adenosylmethionine synthetase N-terminal domain-containing protein [Streptomyces sp. NBC_00654]|nr:S-adenosylmethionine synthetase N-terminal domain-containing protein [Streptomyces sp. NBC_00654]